MQKKISEANVEGEERGVDIMISKDKVKKGARKSLRRKLTELVVPEVEEIREEVLEEMNLSERISSLE